MGNISFLDCTLRDGGYINNWCFGNLTIRSVVSRLDATGIDYIEVGFLDSRVSYNNERSMFPDIPSVAKTLGNVSPKTARLVAMIDYGTFDEELLIPADESCLFGIRLIFTKDKTKEALKYAEKIKKKGYGLFLNLVSTSSYHDKELLDLIDKINCLQPFCVSIVDTYGLMFENEMAGYALLLDRNLDPKIMLGYHSHNNLQMSNANTIEFIRLHFIRDVVVDSSLLGMGKNAGNTCTELILSYANHEQMRTFDIVQALECAYIDIGKFQNRSNWGYSLEFLISAVLRCSPNWTKFYMEKKNLSLKDIYAILSELPEDKKYLPSFFNKDLGEKLLDDYMNKNVNDTAAKKKLLCTVKDRKVLLICPGKTVQSCREKIDQFIEENHPVVITINFVSSMFKTDYVWISNAIRYSQISSLYGDITEKPKLLLTSNITPLPSLDSDMIFNFKTLYMSSGGDISAVLLLGLLFSLGTDYVFLAGFDGYDDVNDNYFDSGYVLNLSNQSNDKISSSLKRIQEQYKESHVKFVTPSVFENFFNN